MSFSYQECGPLIRNHFMHNCNGLNLIKYDDIKNNSKIKLIEREYYLENQDCGHKTLIKNSTPIDYRINAIKWGERTQINSQNTKIIVFCSQETISLIIPNKNKFQSKKIICPKSSNIELFNTSYLINKNHYLKIIKF